MPDLYQGFLADICAHPEDDVPRLILADWLEDNGEELRAKFIRLQIEAHRLSKLSDDDVAHINVPGVICECRRCDLIRKTGAMLNHGLPNPGWLWAGRQLNEAKLFARVRLHYHRGFVAGVACHIDDWLTYGAAIVISQPVTIAELTSQHPVYTYTNGVSRYTWSAGYDGMSRLAKHDRLPSEWFPDDYNGKATFQSITEAVDWASGKAVAWARQKASLPPLV